MTTPVQGESGFLGRLRERVAIYDGAMGTNIQCARPG